jgi:predicted enzyme related to lactoylglutathione lyase
MNDAFVQHGAFSWCELTTTDVAAANRFYTELLGWGITETPVADAPYHIISIGGREIGGIMAIPPRAGMVLLGKRSTAGFSVVRP